MLVSGAVLHKEEDTAIPEPDSVHAYEIDRVPPPHEAEHVPVDCAVHT